MKLLLYIPEFPFAHHGGAARSMRTIGEFMAAKGHQVHCVSTTATERPCDIQRGTNLDFRGVQYRMVDTIGTTRTWRTDQAENAVNQRWNDQLLSFKPDIVLAYGGHPTDERRYDRAKKNGAKLVFRLSNFGYTLKPTFFRRMDGVITCSQFLSDWYHGKIGIESTPMPLPIWYDDVVAQDRTPAYFTFINPARRKGVALMADVFRKLWEYSPQIPLMVVGESNEPEFQVLRSLGTKVLPWQTEPKAIYRETKVLLVPSIWEEPAGRVVVEAMLNGIPPIITDRGGLPETANGGAYILPLDKSITPEMKSPLPPEVVQPWVDLIVNIHADRPNRDGRLASDWASDRAAAAANVYHEASSLYEAYFENILEAPATERRTGSTSPQYGATPETTRC